MADTHNLEQTGGAAETEASDTTQTWQRSFDQSGSEIRWDAAFWPGAEYDDETDYKTAATNFDGATYDTSVLDLEREALLERHERGSDLTTAAANVPSHVKRYLGGRPVHQSATAVPDAGPLSPLQHTCTICSATFQNSRSLEQHARLAKHRLYECPIDGCGSKYYRQDVFIRHKSTHRETKLHACQTCALHGQEKAFKRKDHLKQHLRNCHSDFDGGRGAARDVASYSPSEIYLAPQPPAEPPNPAAFSRFSRQPGHGRGAEHGPIWDPLGEAAVSETQSDNGVYRSQAVKDIEHALVDMIGDDTEEFLHLKERLELHSHLTTAQLAANLRKLALHQNTACMEINEVEPPERQTKRKISCYS